MDSLLGYKGESMKLWLHGLGAAVVGAVVGASGTFAQELISGQALDLHKAGGVLLGTALLAVVAYFQKSPLA